MQFERLELLVGDKIKDIQNTTVLLVGIGGVGGYAFEALVRSGIGKIIIVDFDIAKNLIKRRIELRNLQFLCL